MPEQSKTSAPQTNEGEGNRTADRAYRDAVARHAEEHDVQREAKEAEEALDSDEAEQLEDAAESGKARGAGPASR